jgi:hypothetical protein
MSDPTTDPYWNKVSLLLQFDGDNGSTTFTDSSGFENTVTPNGGAAISTAQSKFGGASGYFDGVNDYVLVPRSNSHIPLENEDFTFEAWVFLTVVPGPQGSFVMGFGEYGSDADWNLNINSSRNLVLYFNSIVKEFINTENKVPLGEWCHVAASRSGTTANNLRVFVNGIGQAFTSNATTVGTGSRALVIGADQNGNEALFSGYIDSLRITKGVARYAANFTPPTAAFAVGDRIAQRVLSLDRLHSVCNDLALTAGKLPTQFRPILAMTKNIHFSGPGRIVGTVKLKSSPSNVPLVRKVLLFSEQSNTLVAQTWSNSSGDYSFDCLDLNQKYSVIAYDYKQNYRAVIADNLTPEVPA